MKRFSDKRAAREAEARPVRQQLVADVARCEWCGERLYGLVVHEILRGTGYRQKCLDQTCAQLVLCDRCHDLMGGRDWAEQLAILLRSRRDDFDLPKFHDLAGRGKPSLEEVLLWHRRLCFVTSA